MGSRTFRPQKPRAPFSAKAAISRALQEVGGPAAIALRMQRRRSVIHAYGDPDHATHAPFDAVCALVSEGATAPVEHLAALAGGFFLPGNSPREEFSALAARASRARGAVDAEIMQALADGVIDARERAALVDALSAGISALAAARARLVREGGGE